jgi:hypothetical protein
MSIWSPKMWHGWNEVTALISSVPTNPVLVTPTTNNVSFYSQIGIGLSRGVLFPEKEPSRATGAKRARI